ncbi:sensor histidine kinase [Gorillibacterium sp. sgz5001074]|uniref:sensor histidine kinase n=1 Tax=Gorillibacterium sp. sgz5001074 TaxID=3446695 RepID=UPI003F66ADEA
MPKINMYSKMITLLLLMLLPIIGLYFYSNKTSTDVLGTELNRSNTNQLAFFQNQVNTAVDNVALWPTLLLHDPDIMAFKDEVASSPYFDLDTINLVKRIQSKLNIQESSSNWKSKIYIYSPSLGRVLSDNDAGYFEPARLQDQIKPGWQVAKEGEPGQTKYMFSLFTVYPYNITQTFSHAGLIIEVRFDSTNIEDLLDRFKSDGRRDPLFYKEDTGVIYNRSANRDVADGIIAELMKAGPDSGGHLTLTVGGKPYMVNTVYSAVTGWKLIDYIPMSDIMKPIQTTNRLFYVSVTGLLLMCSVAAYLLYAQVQVPLKKLVQGFQRLKNGDYSVRMKTKGNNEFTFVFDRFNSMVVQIEELFHKVYLEQIHVREAKLKQLQSQINPHFFYNCFSFISSMAKLRNVQAVVAMSQSLSHYYRYTTRQEKEMVTLSEEVVFVTHYLEIQRMRMNRLQFEIDIPLRMTKWMIPPLVLQPLVENAVLHGIEKRADAGRIRIRGEYGDGWASLTVEDDGNGVNGLELPVLEQKLGHPMDEQMGCGLWNVHQRMKLRYGSESGLSFGSSEWGGFKAVLQWRVTLPQEEKGEPG